MQRLLEQGVDPNVTDKHGSTALHWAAGSGRLGVCKFLVNVVNIDGMESLLLPHTFTTFASLSSLPHTLTWIVYPIQCVWF